MMSRLRTPAPIAVLVLLTLVLGTSAALGLWIQPQWRSRGDTETVLVFVVIVGAPLVGATITSIARAPWLTGIKVGAVAAYAAMVASFSMLYMIYSMPDWLTTIQRVPGASTTRQLTDAAQTLEDVAWFGVLSMTAALASLLLVTALSSRLLSHLAPGRLKH